MATDAEKDKKKDEEDVGKTVTIKKGEIVVSEETLKKVLEGQAESDRKSAELEAKMEGMQELMGQADTSEPKLREKKDFEPKFRTVRIRKHPMGGNHENPGYIVGWTNRGAYQVVDKSGVAPVIVDMIDVLFLGHERGTDGKLKAESISLRSMYNAEQVHCKIIKTERAEPKVPTGEEIDVTVFDPKHGMMATGDKIDGWVSHSEITYTIQIPGVTEPTVIDAKFVN